MGWLKKIKWKGILVGTLTLLVLVLMGMGENNRNETPLPAPQIYIHAEGESAFLTENELRERLAYQGLFEVGSKLSNLAIEQIENAIKRMQEVKEVEVYTELDGNWTIDVELRRPIARVFNQYGESYYLDSEGYKMLPSELHTARVVVVNGFIPDRMSDPAYPDLINNDSLISIRKLDDIYRITNYVCNDPLLQAQIAQIYLEKNGDFVMTPQVGGHKIIFGTAENQAETERKFKHLITFYKEAIPYEGWNKYSEISLKYTNQIVCKKKN